MNPIVSYLSGILAAFTPCVVVLIPILFYRFFNKEKKQWQSFIVFIIGFLIFYLLLSYFFAFIFTSQLQNGFKIGLGIMFVILGILSFMERINPLKIPLFNNSFLLGVVFALIAASNPCALPYFSLMIVGSKDGIIIINILFFGLGVITPSILFSFTSQKIIGVVKKSGKFFHSINKLMSILLIFSGIYLAITIKNIIIYDLYIIAGMLLLTFFIIIRSFFIINSKNELFKLRNIILILSLLMIIFVAVYHCNAVLSNNIGTNNGVCSNEVLSCKICFRCILIFGLSAFLGFIGMFFLDRLDKFKK